MQQAYSVGLPEYYRWQIENGSLNIDTVTDEDLKKKISDFQSYYDKAQSALETIRSLREEEAKLYKQRFDLISDYYDKYLQQVEHRTSVLEERIRRQETQGYLVSQTYYQKLIDNENFMLHSLERQKGELLQSLADAVSSGKIQKYSNDWYIVMPTHIVICVDYFI